MNPGDVLMPGTSLFSPSGIYQLVMQTDGNLVLYSGSSPLWASNTAGKAVRVCIMQTDGNLVIYGVTGNALWASNTNGKPGVRLVVQDDGNVVLYQSNNAAVWATSTVHTVGADTLIYRARLKRWTNVVFLGCKGNDTILVKLPPGATLKSAYIGPINTNEVNPGLSSAPGSSVGSAYSGARITRIVPVPGAVAITTHWWFNAFSDAEYSISVWVTGPTSYPVEDPGSLASANVDNQVWAQAGKWFENNEANLIAAAAAVVVACVDIATLGTGAAVTTPVLIAAISTAVTAGSKIALSPNVN